MKIKRHLRVILRIFMKNSSKTNKQKTSQTRAKTSQKPAKIHSSMKNMVLPPLNSSELVCPLEVKQAALFRRRSRSLRMSKVRRPQGRA